MAVPFKTEGYKTPVWKLFDRQKPHTCPNCTGIRTLKFIGFDPNYAFGLRANLYMCTECDAWLDCIWPKTRTVEVETASTSILETQVAAAVVIEPEDAEITQEAAPTVSEQRKARTLRVGEIEVGRPGTGVLRKQTLEMPMISSKESLISTTEMPVVRRTQESPAVSK